MEQFLLQWSRFVERRAFLIVLFFLLLSGASAYWTVTHLGINTDLSDMISERLDFHKRWLSYKEDFPDLSETVLVVIDSNKPSKRREAANWLESQVNDNPDIFVSATRLNGGEFFERNALLYEPSDSLNRFVDDFSKLQPLVYGFSQSPTLAGFFGALNRVYTSEEVLPLLRQLDSSLDSGGEALNYEKLVVLGADQSVSRQFIEIKPRMNYSEILPAEPALRKINSWVESYKDKEVSFGVTGTAALGYEELSSVSKGAALAGILSLILVSMILVFGLRSFRLIFVTLVSLVVGLVLTAGFAALAIGHLNMISVAFAVLFIGLGVDYSIHLCARYRELVASGSASSDAIAEALRGVGSSLVICTLTTSAGFFSFVPTAYAGVSELGIIAGAGMFVNLFVHIALFPALIRFLPLKSETLSLLPESVGGQISSWAFKKHNRIILVAGLLLVASAPLALRIDFDENPLNLQDPSTEAYKVYRELLKDENLSPWTIKILDADEERLAAIEALPQVSQVIGIDDFVPEAQAEKLKTLKGLSLSPLKDVSDSVYEDWGMLQAFEKDIERELPKLSDGEQKRVLESIQTKIRNLLLVQDRLLTERKDQETVVKALRSKLVSPTKEFLNELRRNTPREAIETEDLPKALRDRFVSASGTQKYEVFPTEDLMNIEKMREFSEAVLKIDPSATDDPVTLPKTGDAVVTAFLQASAIAFVLILLLLLLMTKSFLDSALILFPIFFALTLTQAIMTVFGYSWNFANVIVIPLLLGIGVDSGVHMMHRMRQGNLVNALAGSTARAVFYSALTTICSFGTLSISTHRGTSSMGFTLTIGTLVVMLSTLILLPASVRKMEEVLK